MRTSKTEVIAGVVNANGTPRYQGGGNWVSRKFATGSYHVVIPDKKVLSYTIVGDADNAIAQYWGFVAPNGIQVFLSSAGAGVDRIFSFVAVVAA